MDAQLKQIEVNFSFTISLAEHQENPLIRSVLESYIPKDRTKYRTVSLCKYLMNIFCLLQEDLEKKKAEYAEKMRNKIAMIHKEAEERKAMVEAKKSEDVLKAEEMAAKYRATGNAPSKLFGCFGP